MSAHVQIDELDRRILELLREDARRTIADIAKRVNLSSAPVKRRIDRLQALGVIAGYTVVLDHTLIGPSIDAVTELRFQGNADPDEILTVLQQIPEIREVFTMAGDPDALLRIRVDDVEHLKHVVNVLRRTPRVTGTKTLMVLEHWRRPVLATESAEGTQDGEGQQGAWQQGAWQQGERQQGERQQGERQ